MMDTVWLVLTPLADSKGLPSNITVMFGPGGVTEFYAKNGSTYLEGKKYQVEETPAYILDALQKVRRTEGALSGEEEQGS